jgi:hypothetical protein
VYRQAFFRGECEVADEEYSEEFALNAFRKHRHDVMNSLQLVKSYTQIQKPEAALRWLDHLAEWLQMISRCQVQLRGRVETVIWQLAQSPHIRLDCRAALTLDDEEAKELQGVLDRLELWAGKSDTMCTVHIYPSGRNDSARLTCEIMQTDDECSFLSDIEPWYRELKTMTVIASANEG